MQSLYRNATPEHIFSFDQSALVAALERIYRREIDPHTQIDEGLFRAMRSVFDKAVDVGFSGMVSDREADFIDAIRYNDSVFVAFKVHRLQNDVAAQLLDQDGLLKSYSQWRSDVQEIVDHHTDTWLQTEYDTAVKRADLAAQWVQFEREKDVLPNLRWLRSTSINPRESHKIYWGMVLPMSDPFWSEHRPGDEWGCKCGLEATDDPASETIPTAGAVKHAPGLAGNPAQTGKIFSDDHPYIANAHRGGAAAVRSFLSGLGIEPAKITKFKSGGELRIPAALRQNSFEQAKNIRAYTELAKLHGERYKLLSVSNEAGRKNPDALNLKTGFFSDMKNPMTGNGKNAIQTAIKSASKQRVEELYIYLTNDYTMISIYEGLIAGLQAGRAKSLQSIIIRLKNGTLKRYDVDKLRGRIKK